MSHGQTRIISPFATGITGIDEFVDAAGIAGKRSIIVFAPWRPCYHGFGSRAILAGASSFERKSNVCFNATHFWKEIRSCCNCARHYAAGTEALERSDDVLAIAELERAAELVPHASEIQNHLGLAYWSDGRPEAAQMAFEKAVELDCDNLVAQANLERLMRSEDDVVVEARVEGLEGLEGVEGESRVDENGE